MSAETPVTITDIPDIGIPDTDLPAIDVANSRGSSGRWSST